jgi:hypothetical protein
VRRVGALQAQAIRAARLAVRPRSIGLDAEAVRRASNDDRSVVRTWAMRGTLHMVPAEDVRWLVALLGPDFAARNRRRRLQLGLDDDTCKRGLRAIEKVLAATGPLPRDELMRRVAQHGDAIDLKGQARPHLLAYAAMHGLICHGPDLADDESTYALLDEWVPAAPELAGDAALAELSRRYVAGHGPVGPRDLAAWAGITLGRARRGLELIGEELREVEASNESAWILAAAALDPDDGPVGPDGPDGLGGPDDRPCVRLLPHFDAYLLGYDSRDLVLSPEFAGRIQAGGGMIHPSIVLDGRIVGTWRQRRRRDALEITVEPFERLPRSVRPALDAEIADVGRFLHVPISVGSG